MTVMSGAERVETGSDGQAWSSRRLAYQDKNQGWLREEYAALGAVDRELVDAALAGTGWVGMFG